MTVPIEAWPVGCDWMVGMSEGLNVDPAELKNFDELASRWLDPEGEFKSLHRMNKRRCRPLVHGWITSLKSVYLCNQFGDRVH